MKSDSVVRLWAVPLDAGGAGEALLSADERVRAGKFFRDRDGARFVAARAGLRQVLAACLGAEPGALRFVYSAVGKPSLAPEFQPDPPLDFNLSHSHDLALVAVTRGASLGVDVEHEARALPDLPAMARRFFSPHEAAAMLGLPAEQQPGAFMRCWTRKEAYLKARGDGIAGGLSRFDVSVAPGEPPALLRTADDPDEARHWTLFDVAPAPGYTAAVAVRHMKARLVQERFPLTE
jgi:4'-phosphopantetheinyl transferase